MQLQMSLLEERGMTIPVLGVNCIYKHHVTFEGAIQINLKIKEYNGVRMTIGYEVTDKKTGNMY